MTMIIDWFEGGLRRLSVVGFAMGGVSLLSFAKADERYAGAKFIAFCLLFTSHGGFLKLSSASSLILPMEPSDLTQCKSSLDLWNF
ncbi:MAG: hypothetical protein GY822_19170 [Deltaproteobacteria bacterium]|nr:hypothetical protein [Deltaproteobacteria bacterium]